MKYLKLVCFLTLAGLTSASHAELLWNNGDHDNNGAGVNNMNQSVLDDFYVPGAGWFIDGAETHGIFLNPNKVVSEVDVIIWPADFATGEPNGDSVIVIENVTFEAVDTNEDWGGYDKIRVTVDFENTFLDGQEYYWIELDIKDQTGTRLKLLERQSVNFVDAHVRGNPYPFSTGVDLAYRLFGTPVAQIYIGGPDGYQTKGLDNGREIVSLQIQGLHQRFEPGLYQIQMLKRQPVVYRFDERGKRRYDFAPNPSAPQKLSTPIGDDLCGKAPDLIHEFCQAFVACAMYDLFCH